MNTEISNVQRTKTNRRLLVGLLVINAVLHALAVGMDFGRSAGDAPDILLLALLFSVSSWIVMKQLAVQIDRAVVAGCFLILILCLFLAVQKPWDIVFDFVEPSIGFFGAYIALFSHNLIFLTLTGASLAAAIIFLSRKMPIMTKRRAYLACAALFATAFLSTTFAFLGLLSLDRLEFFHENQNVLYAVVELPIQFSNAIVYFAAVYAFFNNTRGFSIAGLCQPKDEETCKEVEAKTPGFNRAPNTEEHSFMLSPLIFMIPVLLLFVVVDSVYESAMASPLFYNAGYVIMLLKYPMLFIAAAFIGTIGTRKEGVSTAKLSITIVSLGFIAGSLMLASYLLYHALAFQDSAFGTASGTAVLVLMCLLLIIPLVLTICAYTDKQFKVMPPRYLTLKNTLLVIAPLAFIAVSLVITGPTITDGTATTASDILMNFFEPEPPLVAMLKGWLDPLFWLVAFVTVWRFSRQVDASRCRQVA